MPTDIDAAWDAVRDAERPRIHTFISTSDIHIEHQLQTTREDVKGQARAAVAHAKQLLRRRRVLADGRHARRPRVHRRGRADRHRRGRHDDQHPRHRRLHDAARVRRLPGAPLRAGARRCATSCSRCTATTTSGWPSPTRSPALLAGARQVECAINGIGERAGNASLEEIVMLLRTREADVGLRTGVNTQRDRAHEPPGLAPDRLRRAAQQGDRRAATRSRTSRASTRTAC